VERTGTTAASGQAQFSNVPVGGYSVMATLTGFTCPPSTVNVTEGGNHTASVSCSTSAG
jgi:hypothetical protein